MQAQQSGVYAGVVILSVVTHFYILISACWKSSTSAEVRLYTTQLEQKKVPP